jgi:hypothetical protein
MLLLFLLSFMSATAAPLQQSSLITIRTPIAARGPGGNTPPVSYSPLILEEWGSSGLLQEWTAPCTLPGLSTETWTEGRLSPRYPWGDQVWFLCRNVPVNSSLSYSPAPVRYMYLSEEGFLTTCIEDFVYPNGTNLLNLLAYNDLSQGTNVYYLLGGGSTGSGPANPPRAAQPRIRVDSALCAPADTEGSLLAFPQGVTINQLRILDRTLYGTGLFTSSAGGAPQPTIFQIGSEGVLPTGTRNPTANIAGFPLVFSSWTEPLSSIWWRTGLNRTGYVALYNNTDATDKVFTLPPSSTGGTLGGASWSVATARQEGSEFAVYLSNTTHIVKNTLNGLTTGQPYQALLQAPPGWRYLSAHARNPTIPTPSATATATASSSASASATATATATSTESATATSSASSTATSTSTSTATASSTASSSPSSSAYPTSTATRTSDPNGSPTPSISISSTASPSNGTIPVPPNNAQAQGSSLTPADQAGIGLGTIAAVCLAGLALVHLSPSLKNLWTRQFGKSFKPPKKSVSFRSPVTTDAPITISHNPQVLVQHRLEQLKELQKQISTKEVNQSEPSSATVDRTKKEFGPTVSGSSV